MEFNSQQHPAGSFLIGFFRNPNWLPTKFNFPTGSFPALPRSLACSHQLPSKFYRSPYKQLPSRFLGHAHRWPPAHQPWPSGPGPPSEPLCPGLGTQPPQKLYLLTVSLVIGETCHLEIMRTAVHSHFSEPKLPKHL